MLTLIDELSIAECYVCPIEYYDVSGLNDDEVPLIDAFLENFEGCTFIYDDVPYYTRDYITGMMATCLDVKVYKNED